MKAISAGTMIDGSGSAPVRDAVVLIDGATIVAAGSADSVKFPDGTERVDAPGLLRSARP